jgi:hypothetical protein
MVAVIPRRRVPLFDVWPECAWLVLEEGPEWGDELGDACPLWLGITLDACAVAAIDP